MSDVIAKYLKRYKKHLMKMKKQYQHSENRKKRKARVAKEKFKAKKPRKTKAKRRPKGIEREEDSASDTGVKDIPRMTRSQVKNKGKAKVRPPRAAPPEDVDKLGNTSASLHNSEADGDASDLNSDVSDISDKEVEELFRKMMSKKMEARSKKPPKPETPARAKGKGRERGRNVMEVNFPEELKEEIEKHGRDLQIQGNDMPELIAKKEYLKGSYGNAYDFDQQDKLDVIFGS
ncbi:hypothetical protein DL98DRAFT_597693 [Cadophora sp. DSE1049]|nr:hypothetical protein DL98DRAFT_597693 [Cadophora sp. DSE1049]